MDGYLIPANAKKGTLWLNLFRPVDALILAVGILVSLGGLAIVPSTNLAAVIIALLPGCICGLLVFPVPNYHNVMCALISIYKFYTEKRNYVWKGWCFYERFSENSKSRK